MDAGAVYGAVAGLLTGGLGGWIASIYQIRTQSEFNEKTLQLERDKFEMQRTKELHERHEADLSREADVSRTRRAVLLRSRDIANVFVESRNAVNQVNFALSSGPLTSETVDQLIDTSTNASKTSQPFYDLMMELYGLGYDAVATEMAVMHAELLELTQFLDLNNATDTGDGSVSVRVDPNRKTDVKFFDKARMKTNLAINTALESLQTSGPHDDSQGA
ncbi:hypothetical protein ABFT23_10495 [Nocardioides sp. C4-1]|uniref:hypothetical protein n=1 Tax=Nocardioides sp. C4-1 TaxID=3151851 RepID=UPI003262E56B